MDIIFCTIICGQWETDENKLQNTLYALSTEGKVYKFVGFGWQELPHKIVEGKTK